MRSRKALFCLILIIVCMLPGVIAGAVAWNDLKAGNPVLPGYFADPCVKKFGDTYYLYVTPDGWGVGEGPFVIWTSKDFVHWTSHPSNWPTTNNKWAPSVVFANNKYYLYTQVPCQVWVATSNSPLGPWTNPIAGGGCMIPDQTPAGTITLDGEVYIDTDGQAYMMYGTWWTPTIGKLNPDLISFASTPVQYFGSNHPYGIIERCMEAPYMFKRNGIYYNMYSDNFCQDSSYCVKYSTGTTPMGPWTFASNNPILETNMDGTVDGPGHHTMLEDNGKVYIVYHRHDNPHHPDGAHRQTCIDELRFNADGSIEKIVPSHTGMGYLAPSTVRDTNLALGRPTTASSSASSDFVPGYATDENNGTLWKASSYTYPQWLQVDLGQNRNVKRVETQFEFAQVAYKYQIQYSTDGTTWNSFADRRTNTTSGSPMIDSGNVTGRYFRITLTGDNYPSRPSPAIGIWGFNIYDGVDKPNQAPAVYAGTDKVGCISFPTVSLAGRVDDDGLPNGPITTLWSKLSGPGTVTFRNVDRRETTATFSAIGTYVLKLEANDGQYTSSDTVTYTINTLGEKLIWYKFDEPSGPTIYDVSGNLQDGFLQKHATRGTGVIGNAGVFDGVDDYALVPALGSPGKMTIAAWVKLDSLADYSSIISANGSATGYPQLSIRGTGEIQLTVVGNSPADVKSAFKFTETDLGKWVHIAVVYDTASTAKTVKFYVNGKYNSYLRYTSQASIVLTSGLRVGARDNSRYFDGKIDDLVIYNRALTDAQVANLVSGVQWSSVGDSRKLADGQSITLKAKPVTCAPRDAYGARSTNFFYIEEVDRSAVLRVQDGAIGTDAAEAELGATVTGIMRTSSTTGDRYLELSSVPEIESSQKVEPFAATTKMIETDSVIVGMLVNVMATVKSITPDKKTLTISDGYTADGREVATTVKSDLPIGLISVGDMVFVVGVVTMSGTTVPAEAKRELLLRSILRFNPPVTPITSGLVAYYKLDETTGTSALDSSGNGKTATLINGPLWTSGKVGRAVSLDGSDDHIKMPTGIISSLSDFTVCAWVRLDAAPYWSRIFDFGSGTGKYMFLCNRGTDGLRYAITVNGNASNAEQILDIGQSITIGAWKHVAVTRSGNTVKIYMDGVLAGQNTNITLRPSDMGSTTQNYIGKSQYGDPLLDGKVDDFRIYNRALSLSELAQIYAGY